MTYPIEKMRQLGPVRKFMLTQMDFKRYLLNNQERLIVEKVKIDAG